MPPIFGQKNLEIHDFYDTLVAIIDKFYTRPKDFWCEIQTFDETIISVDLIQSGMRLLDMERRNRPIGHIHIVRYVLLDYNYTLESSIVIMGSLHHHLGLETLMTKIVVQNHWILN